MLNVTRLLLSDLLLETFLFFFWRLYLMSIISHSSRLLCINKSCVLCLTSLIMGCVCCSGILRSPVSPPLQDQASKDKALQNMAALSSAQIVSPSLIKNPLPPLPQSPYPPATRVPYHYHHHHKQYQHKHDEQNQSCAVYYHIFFMFTRWTHLGLIRNYCIVFSVLAEPHPRTTRTLSGVSIQ